VLAAGHAVIVDAVYAGEEERLHIEVATANLQVPFRGLWLTAGAERLIGRVSQRGQDASDATEETVRAQLRLERGPLSGAWTEIEAGGTPSGTLSLAASALGLGAIATRDTQPHDGPAS
jgi:predicted kinase